MKQQALNFGTRVVGDDIVDVDFSGRPLRVMPAGGAPVETHTVIVATGARANYLGLPSEEKFKNRGVSACAVCDGALPRFRNQPLAVIGGGDSAIEEAIYLTAFASRSTWSTAAINCGPRRSCSTGRWTNPKIELVWSHVVDEVLGNDQDGVTGLRLNRTTDGSLRELPVVGMFAAIGHTPNTAFLRGKLEMTDKGYIRWTTPFRTTPASRAYLPPATWPTTTIARRSLPPAPAAWRRWTPNGTWRPRGDEG